MYRHPHGQQLVDLLFGLCAFGDDQQSQLSGHVDHRFDDFQPFAGIVLIEVDEFHVKFDHIDVDVLEHVQRRIRRSEIIHQHRDVVRMQLADVLSTLDRLLATALSVISAWSSRASIMRIRSAVR